MKSFADIIVEDICSIKKTTDSWQILHDIPIKLLLLDKKQGIYLSDGKIIIQSVISSSNARYKIEIPQPFNEIRTNYYNFSAKKPNLFIFNHQDIINDCPYPTPYEPQFHFRDRINNFDTNIAVSQISNITQIMLVFKWSIRIINIANTGFYGIILEVINYQRLIEKFVCDINLHSILYEKSISQKLQVFRINQIKQGSVQLNKIQRRSLCYYRKNIKASSISKSLMANFVVLDRNSKFINTNNHSQINYIPLGKIQGVLKFLRPVNFDKPSNKMVINFQQFKETFNQTSNNETSNNETNEYLQSDVDEISQNSENSQAISVSEEKVNEDDVSSDEEQEQILRSIYSQQLSKMTIL